MLELATIDESAGFFSLVFYVLTVEEIRGS